MSIAEVVELLEKHLPKWAWAQRFARPANDGHLYSSEEDNFDPGQPLEEANIDDALLMAAKIGENQYLVTMDLDMDAVLLPSSQEGHHHLIINKVLSRNDYNYLMDALTNVGLVQPGWSQSAKDNELGATLRLPWVKKGEDKPLNEQ